MTKPFSFSWYLPKQLRSTFLNVRRTATQIIFFCWRFHKVVFYSELMYDIYQHSLSYMSNKKEKKSTSFSKRLKTFFSRQKGDFSTSNHSFKNFKFDGRISCTLCSANPDFSPPMQKLNYVRWGCFGVIL